MKKIISFTVFLLATSMSAKAFGIGPAEIEKICTIEEGSTPDFRSKYIEALNKSHTVPWTFERGRSTRSLYEYCERDGVKVENCKIVRRHLSELLRFLEAGEIGSSRHKLKTTPLSDPYIDEAVAFLENEQSPVGCVKIITKKKVKKAEPGFGFNWSNLSITKDSTTATKTKLSDKVAAEFGVSLDRGTKQKITNADDTVTLKNKDLTSANFNIALVDFLKYTRKEDSTNLAPGPSLTPFIALNYQSDLDPKEETDDFSVGVIWKQYFRDKNFQENDGDKFRFELDHFLLEGSYITDIEQRESQQWAGQLTLPFASFDGSSFNSNDPFFTYYVTADLVLDHMKIARAGDKKALIKLTEEQDTDKLTRIGYDIGFVSSFKLDDAWSFGFDAKYQYRDAFQNGGLGDADRWEMGWDFTPNVNDNLSFGITYQRGEVLKSLKEEELWKFGVKYKQ